MKPFSTFLLSGLLLASCAGSANRPDQTKIGQAIKTEGEIFLRQGNYTAALTRLLEAKKSLPEDPLLYNSLGLTYIAKKRDDLAEASFKKALSLKPDYLEAVNNLGVAYLRQEKWDLAIDTLKSLLDNLLYPTPHFPLSNIGWAFLGKKEFASAETYFKKSLDESPEFPTAIHGIAQVYIRTGQTDRAIQYLNEKLQGKLDAAILHADLAQAYEEKGQIKFALRSWELVLKLSPENSSLAQKAKDRLRDLQ